MQRLFFLCLIILFSLGDLSSQVSPPKFSQKGGFYKNPLMIYLTPENSSDSIYYTIDGSEPTRNSPKYSSPLSIDSTTVLRAKAFLSDSVFSNIRTNTYFINESTLLPVVSLSTDPKNLWDPKTGIYVSPNYSEDWERPVHLEFYESDGNLGFSMDAGVKINGETSRNFPQKSLAILARKIYGYGKINYKMFPDLPIDGFEVLVLRNSGTDWNNTMFRDGLMHSLLKDHDVDVLAYRPSVVFLNGQYWGIHNIREKADEHYIASHHSNVDPDSVYIVRYWGIQPEKGGLPGQSSYSAFEHFVKTADFTIKKNYDSLKKALDIDEFIGYVIAQIFYDNTDWPANNVKCWRAAKPGGKWRWILWDTDYGFDYLNKDSYKNNSLDFVTGGKNPVFPAPKSAVEFITNLLKNQDIKNNFINRFADLTNSVFKKDSLLRTIGLIKKAIEPEIPRHFKRWNEDPLKWYDNVSIVEKFAANRFPFIQQNFISKFNLKGSTRIVLNVNNISSGSIQINSINISRFPWNGSYFKEVPVLLTAKPKPGYKFKQWLGISDISSNPVTVTPDLDVSVTAVFETDSSFSNIVINEINYNSAPNFDCEDWIELFNAGSSEQDLSGWIFKDEDDLHQFVIPGKTILNRNNYLVLCRDTVKFSSLFPLVKNRLGNFDFGLNNSGELIRLFDPNNILIDSLTFDDNSPWPVEADGTGKTLELKNPALDNSIPANWVISKNNGSPGKLNDAFTLADNKNSGIPLLDFALFQNYPNPFNPVTKLNYFVPIESHVKIAVYNSLGELIKELVNLSIPAGYHELKFNAAGIPSGVYFCRIEAHALNGSGDFREVIKMLVLK